VARPRLTFSPSRRTGRRYVRINFRPPLHPRRKQIRKNNNNLENRKFRGSSSIRPQPWGKKRGVPPPPQHTPRRDANDQSHYARPILYIRYTPSNVSQWRIVYITPPFVTQLFRRISYFNVTLTVQRTHVRYAVGVLSIYYDYVINVNSGNRYIPPPPPGQSWSNGHYHIYLKAPTKRQTRIEIVTRKAVSSNNAADRVTNDE